MLAKVVGWKKEDEKVGFYNENGEVVSRYAIIKIPTDIIPKDATVVATEHIPAIRYIEIYENLYAVEPEKMGKLLEAYWMVGFAHSSFPKVDEGESPRAIAEAVKRKRRKGKK